MNVAIFSDNDFDVANGITTTLMAALKCAPAGMRLRIYTAATLPVEQPDYLALRTFGMPSPFNDGMTWYVPRLFEYVMRARADRIDVVHLSTPGPIGLAALFVAWRLRLPLIGSLHSNLAPYAHRADPAGAGALMRRYLRWSYGKCAQVLVPSERTRQLLIQSDGRAEQLTVWPRGVDVDLFAPKRRSITLRDQWHVSSRRPALLYVGRLSREKGLSLLAPLRDRLHSIGLEHRWIIVGQGPMRDELRAALPDAAFMGALTRDVVADAFASADVLVCPISTETEGNAVLEAQASGLPVIVSGDGDPCEHIIDSQTGAVCHTENPDEWARAVARVLGPSHPALRASARAYTLTRRWETMLEPLYRAYREVARVGSATAQPPAVIRPAREGTH